MSRNISVISIVVALALVVAGAKDARVESAADIMKKADKIGYAETSRTEMIQKVVTPSGDSRTFKIVGYSENGNEKGLTEYLAPNQVRGMKILTLNEGDDIWSYFPRTNRTRKIASSARNQKVQGSDFTYDDMATGKMAKQWKGKVVSTEKVAGRQCFKLDITPTPSGPPSYSKAIAWVDKADYLMLRIVYFDSDGDKLKQLDIGDYQKVSGVLIPHRYAMTNLIDGGKTMIKVTKAEVNIKLEPGLFAEANLGK